MSPVSSLLSHISCLTFPVSHLLSHFSCLTSSISCLMPPVSRILFPISRFLFPVSVSCLLLPVSRLLSHVSCFLSPVYCFSCLLLSPVSRLHSPVSTLPPPVTAADLIHNELAVLCSKLADLGNLAFLALLADWEKKKIQRTWNLADLGFSAFPFSWAKFELAISHLHFSLGCPNFALKKVSLQSET